MLDQFVFDVHIDRQCVCLEMVEAISGISVRTFVR